MQILLLSAGVAVAAGCGGGNTNEENRKAFADRAWKELTSGGPQAVRYPGENAFSHFWRQVELSNARRRKLGLEFWADYPDDPRRYNWLLMTVHLPPRYTRDTQVGPQSEGESETGSVEADRQTANDWNEIYPGLRKEFWDAESVSDWQRRYLWLGELEHRIDEAVQVIERGGRVDTESLLLDVAEFTVAYEEPFSEVDRKPHSIVVGQLIMSLVSRVGELGLGERGYTILYETITEHGSSAARDFVKEQFDADGNYLDWRKRLSEAEQGWILLAADAPGSINAPLDEPAIEDIAFVAHFKANASYRKYRENGLRLWQEQPHRESQIRWLAAILQSPYHPYDIAPIDESIRGYAENDSRRVAIDRASTDEWQQTYKRLRDELLGDPVTTVQERAWIAESELVARSFEARATWSRYRDKAAAKSLLDEVLKTHEEFAELSTGVGRTALNGLVDMREQYGLSEQDLLEFFAIAMDGRATGDLKDLIVGAAHRLRLITGEELPALSAPTLDGEPFDIADLRGQIVLVDHWNTTCSSCIAAMPLINDVYLRYKEKGFEVVSVAYDGIRKRRSVVRIEETMGYTWTTLAADDIYLDTFERYGFTGFPQYWLLNRDGTLYADTAEVDLGRNLEALLDEMLAAEAVEKEAATVH